MAFGFPKSRSPAQLCLSSFGVILGLFDSRFSPLPSPPFNAFSFVRIHHIRHTFLLHARAICPLALKSHDRSQRMGDDGKTGAPDVSTAGAASFGKVGKE